jgi:membrane protein
MQIAQMRLHEGGAMLAPKQFWDLIKRSYNDWSEDKVPKLAAALAYYTAISLAPLLVLSVTLLGNVEKDAAAKIENQMQILMGSAGKTMAHEMITNAKQSTGTLATIVSFAVLLFGASGVFGELQDSMNTIWEVRPKPNAGWWAYLRKRFLSLAMVFGVAFLLLVSLVVSTILGSLVHRIAGEGKVVGFALDAVLTIGVATVLFAAIFRFLPDVKMAWADVWLGAGVTAVLFTIGKYLLTLYLTKGSTASAYGAAGSLAAVLIWVYYSAQIMFFGAELTQAYAAKFGSKIVPSEYAEPVTAEARAQMGMTSQKPSRNDTRGDDRGGLKPPYRQPVPNRRVVTIEQPSQMNRQGYLMAAGGLAAGVIVGAAGVLTGRRWGEPRLTALQINNRLDAIEKRVTGSRSVDRFGKELAIAQRVALIEKHITDATTSYKRRVNPPWYMNRGRISRRGRTACSRGSRSTCRKLE